MNEMNKKLISPWTYGFTISPAEDGSFIVKQGDHSIYKWGFSSAEDFIAWLIKHNKKAKKKSKA